MGYIVLWNEMIDNGVFRDGCELRTIADNEKVFRSLYNPDVGCAYTVAFDCCNLKEIG